MSEPVQPPEPQPAQGWGQQPPPPGGGQQPPPGPPPPGWGQQPPGPEKKGRFSRGCLLGGCGTLLGLVLIIVIIVVVASNSGKKTTPTNPTATRSGVTQSPAGHPPSADVSITSCTVDPTTSIPDAKVQIINHSSKTSHYFISVEFVNASNTRLAEGAVTSTDVASGQKVIDDAYGTAQVNTKITCKITSVDRISAVG